jgi:hypothetical protein
VCVREENDSGLQRWGRGEREQEWEGRRREREGDARTVRRSNTCGEKREKKKGNGEKYGAKTAGRWMKE